MPTNPFVLIQERLANLLKAQGLEKLHNPITQLLKQGLHDLEFVSLDEFDAQKQVLERLQTQVKQLENRIAELEAQRKHQKE